MKKYFSFCGYATRLEYWAVIAIYIAVASVAVLTGASEEPNSDSIRMGYLITIAALIPSIWVVFATTIRRLRDAGLNLWWFLAICIPGIAWIPTIVFGCLPTRLRENENPPAPLRENENPPAPAVRPPVPPAPPKKS